MEGRNLWVDEFPGGIMVCDSQGIILEMNDKCAETYRADGGRALIGTNVLDCHPEPARTKLRRLMEKQQVNVYTIEKRGKKKLMMTGKEKMKLMMMKKKTKRKRKKRRKIDQDEVEI